MELSRLKMIFAEALAWPTGPLRVDYLNDACGKDHELRKHAEALLRDHDQLGHFLGSSVGTTNHLVEIPAGTAKHDRPLGMSRTGGFNTDGDGSMIGVYKLLRHIGEGGMGIVFMALQETPVKRRVALKVIKPGMDSTRVVARFEAERQALAIMDHPNIARVLDAGATYAGRPFFVMELVQGVPITEFCDQNQLSLKERLELFIPVCRGIAHAHQKGIIHRDIKPSNILVTLHDGKPVPKVIDFGVSKAIDQTLTQRTMFTEPGAVIGTLEYMSPEQAEIGAPDVDTRSDLYSLGVLLYELLTGSTPLDRTKLREIPYSEIIRRIREEETTKPSHRLTESKDSLPSISARRKLESAQLTKLMRGEIDWIVMKSLEKDRERRYETVVGFANDIQRYLNGDEVEACPPTVSYRLGKFARRHRGMLVSAGSFVLLLLSATVVSLEFAWKADRERNRAVMAEHRATEQRSHALDREKLALESVDRFSEIIRETPELRKDLTLGKLRASLLKEPQAFFKRLRESLQADRETTPESLARLAAADIALGSNTAYLGDTRDAIRMYEEALAIRQQLVRENPKVAEYQADLAMSYYTLGVTKSETGQPIEAMKFLELARGILERLTHENPKIRRFESDLALSYNNIGLLLSTSGRPIEAMASLERALAIRERVAQKNPTVPQAQGGLGGTLMNIGLLKSEIGQPADALVSLQRAGSIFEKMASESPSNDRYQGAVGWALNSIGVVQAVMGKLDEAMASHERARLVFQQLADRNPTLAKVFGDLATSHDHIGVRHLGMSRFGEAMGSFERASVIFERLTREHPDSPEFASRFSGTLHGMAQVDLAKKDFAKGRDRLKIAIEWQRKALATNPAYPAYRRALTAELRSLIQADEGLGQTEEALEARRELAQLGKKSETYPPAAELR